MQRIRKSVFIGAHSLGEKAFYSMYKTLIKNQWKSYEELKEDQEKKLRTIISYAYENIPYYHDLFKNLQLSPHSIQTVEDLQKLPILTKDIIKKNWESFVPLTLPKLSYYIQSTGGSTGTPFQYRLSKSDRFLSGALLYRGWGYGGYDLGDRMVFLAGSSLNIGTKSQFNRKIHEFTRNVRKLSSFDMNDTNMDRFCNIINSFQPKFIRGYASSIYFFSRWIEENDRDIPLIDGVFTTAERLTPEMRKKIGQVFNCEIFNGYGLNDGGISANECEEHIGLHCDTERSILEVVDNDGSQIEHGGGHILATSLNNYAMPFIRYSTGDEGYILDDICPCGRRYRLLKEIIGRQQEMLLTPEGTSIHGEFFTHIFWEIPHVKEFQVIQKDLHHIVFNIVPDLDFDEKSLEKIKTIISTRSIGWKIDFKYVDKIARSHAGKYKFVINELNNGN